jgi:phosphate transport system protein
MLDAAAAAEIIGEDAQIDADYKAAVARLLEHMQRDPDLIAMYINRLWAARALERIGDHAKNICEYVVYMVHGKDIRHVDLDDAERQVRNENG